MSYSEASTATNALLRGGIQRDFTPQNAVDLRAKLADWFTTSSSEPAFDRTVRGAYAHPGSTNPRRDRLNFAQMLEESRLVWADQPFTRLISAMSATSPDDLLSEDEILYPDCFVVFSHPLPAELLGFFDSRRVRALSWHLSWGDRLLFTAYDYAPRTSSINYATFDDPRLTPVRVSGLFPIYTGTLPLADSELAAEWLEMNEAHALDPVSYDHIFRLIRAIAEAARSPMSATERTSESTTAAGRARPSRETNLHRFYLRHPEHADEEGAAVLAAQGKLSPRPHWVRGHWRRQWYATVEQHRWKWIEGHPTRDYEGPETSTPTVHIATNTTDDQVDREPSK